MNRHRLWAFALLSLLASGPLASAQIVYEFADSSGTAQTNFSVAPGETVAIKVFIHELTAGAPTLNSEGGLGSGAVRVRFDNPAGIAAVQTTGDVSLAIPPWTFGNAFIGSGANANTASLAVASFFSGVLPSAQGRIELGTFTFHGLAPGSVSLSAVDPNPAAGFDTSSFNTTSGVPNINYDPLLVAGAATLTVVPEPSSLVFAAIAVTGFIRRLRRRAG